MNARGYAAEVRPLNTALGGGFVAFAPDLPGCVADGESRTVALLNLEDAISCWLVAAKADAAPIPEPRFAEA